MEFSVNSERVGGDQPRRPDEEAACTKNGGCHNEAGGNALNYKTNPQDDAFNFRQTQVFLNCGTPETEATGDDRLVRYERVSRSGLAE